LEQNNYEPQTESYKQEQKHYLKKDNHFQEIIEQPKIYKTEQQKYNTNEPKIYLKQQQKYIGQPKSNKNLQIQVYKLGEKEYIKQPEKYNQYQPKSEKRIPQMENEKHVNQNNYSERRNIQYEDQQKYKEYSNKTHSKESSQQIREKESKYQIKTYHQQNSPLQFEEPSNNLRNYKEKKDLYIKQQSKELMENINKVKIKNIAPNEVKEKIEYKKYNNYDYQTKKQPQITIKKLVNKPLEQQSYSEQKESSPINNEKNNYKNEEAFNEPFPMPDNESPPSSKKTKNIDNVSSEKKNLKREDSSEELDELIDFKLGDELCPEPENNNENKYNNDNNDNNKKNLDNNNNNDNNYDNDNDNNYNNDNNDNENNDLDPIVEKFKSELSKITINALDIQKIKPVISNQWIDSIEKYY
jgi:hypothetical protein